ncbi:hypothetical protein JCM8547_006217 [Rhodosporidiobolus lusitaniae]
MSTPRPAKRRKHSGQPQEPTQPSLAAPAFSVPSLPSSSTPASGSAQQPQPQPQETGDDAQQEQELTEEQIEERQRVYDAVAEDYHDIIFELPLEYHRTFALIRELEDAQQQHFTSLRTSFESLLSSRRSDKSAVPPAEELTKFSAAAIRAGEDKVGLAVSLYETVDRHIRRLDSDLAKFEDTLVIGLREGTLPSHDAPSASLKTPPGAHTSLGAIVLGEREAFSGLADEEEGAKRDKGAGRDRKGKKKERKTAAEREKEGEWKRRREVQKAERKVERKEQKQQAVQAAAGMPIDPNEPVYCYCQRVSFGEMIACENEDCSREWFHLDCVGVSQAPEGEWYCNDCVKELNVDPKTMQRR